MLGVRVLDGWWVVALSKSVTWGVRAMVACGVWLSPGLSAQASHPQLASVMPKLSAQWAGAEDAVYLQAGPETLRLSASPSGSPQLTPLIDSGQSTAQSFDYLSKAQWAFTRGGEAFTAARGSSEPTIRVESPMFNFEVSPYPIRLPLLDLRGMPGCTLIPGRPHFRLLEPMSDTEGSIRSHPLSVELGGSSELGWGVGDPLVIVERIPSVLPLGVVSKGNASHSHRRFLIGEGNRWVVRCAHQHAESCELSLAKIPGDSITGILEFPWSVAPKVGDIGADGRLDALFADASSGTLSLFTDLLRPSPSTQARTEAELVPKRVWLAGGLILMTWLFDGNADGQVDLFVLRTPNPGLAAQLRILQHGILSAEILVYDGSAKGLPRSPSRRRKLICGLSIGIENEVREAQFTSIIQPLSTTQILHVHPNGKIQTLSLVTESSTPLGNLPKGQAIFPFTALRVGNSDHYTLGWRSPKADSIWTIRVP